MFEMNLETIQKACRACLTKDLELTSLSLEPVLGYDKMLGEMLMDLTNLKFESEDYLPKKICVNCVKELTQAFLFKQMCLKSDTTLRDFILSENKSGLEDSNSFEDSKKPKCEKRAVVSQHSNEVNSTGDCNERFSILEQKGNNCNKLQKVKTYQCDECTIQCLGLRSYWKHVAQIHVKMLECDQCGKKCKSQSLLIQHKASRHQDQKPLKKRKSKICLETTKNLSRTCNICNKTFRFYSNLERHRLVHTGEKPFLCNVCGKGFAQMSYLKIHSFIHTGEKPYKCQMCEKSFGAPGTLMTHVRIHTGERPHVCKICGKSFPQSGYLSTHIRTHTGEKPAECNICHRRFNQSGRLLVHMRIHSGEKPYNCKDCGRSFAVKGTLKKHIRTHTGEKPYVCSICGQAFAQSGTLATHMKVHKLNSMR